MMALNINVFLYPAEFSELAPGLLLQIAVQGPRLFLSYNSIIF